MASRLRASLRGYVKPKNVGLAKPPTNPYTQRRFGSPLPANVRPGSTAPAATPAPAAPVPNPATPGAAPAAPAAAAPWDTNYETRVSGINRSRDEQLAGLQNEENRAKQEYGFDDPSDPFNRLKMMERSLQQSRSGAGNSLAAQGQLYSGAYQQAQNQIDFQGSRDRDSLRRSYDDVLGGIQQRRLGVKTGAEEDISQADYDRIMTALQNRPEDPGAPAAPAKASPAKAKPAPKPKVGNAGGYKPPKGKKTSGKAGKQTGGLGKGK